MPFYAEFAYLLRAVFNTDEVYARKLLGLNDNEKLVLFRFIYWNAAHDWDNSGIPDEIKMPLIKSFVDKGYKTFISSEAELSDVFAP